EPVQLEEVDVVGAETREAGIDGREQVLSRQALVGRRDASAPTGPVVESSGSMRRGEGGFVVTDSGAHLRAEHDLVTSSAQRSTEELLAATLAVDVRRVERVDPGLERLADDDIDVFRRRQGAER